MKQNQALAMMKAGHSILLTGEAGSGKTFVLRQFIKWARNKGKNVAITATTGLAATHLDGETIHRWSKIGIMTNLPSNFIKKITKKDAERIKKTDILIIDEISMLNDYQFDMVNQIIKTVRGNNQPFGGIQVILSGDFFQLPPIRKEVQVDMFGKSVAGFVTGSTAYAELSPKVCYLTDQFRQNDDKLMNILSLIRSGEYDQYEIEALLARMNTKPDEVVVNLHTRNVDVDKINQQELARIDGPSQEFVMTSSGDKRSVMVLVNSVLAPQKLKLKIGAAVMALKNDAKNRYVNGSLGIVTNFSNQDGVVLPVVKFNNGKTVAIEPADWNLTENEQTLATVRQIPLRLAYGITIHKSQGMTLDGAVIDLSKAFTPGMGYVALSRVKSLDDLCLLGLNRTALTVSEEARELDIKLKRQSEQDLRQFLA